MNITGVAVLGNNLSPLRRYPVFWWGLEPKENIKEQAKQVEAPKPTVTGLFYSKGVAREKKERRSSKLINLKPLRSPI